MTPLDHTEEVLDYEGNPIPQHELDEETRQLKRNEDGSLYNKGNLTFRDLVMNTVNGLVASDERLGAETKSKMFAIGVKMFRGNKVKFGTSEREFLKDRAGDILTPIAYGRLCQWLEGESQMGEDLTEEDEDGG